MKKSTRNVLIGSGIAAVSAATVSHVVTKYLVRIAIDRDLPKGMNKAVGMEMSKDQKNLDFINLRKEASQKLENAAGREVKITSHDGIPLIGHWYPCEKAKRVIIAMHGWRSSWSRDFGIIADFWKESGCSVLYAEQRAQGGSGGDYMGFGMLERYDCLDWINWVNEHVEGIPSIYLGGASMGATTVLMAADLNLPDNVCGIVADCGFTSPYAIWKHVLQNNLHMPYDLYGAAVNDLCKRKIHVGANEYSAVNAMEKCTVPVLFIHGTDDHFVPVEMTYENYKACTAPKHLFVVPGADHGMSYYTDKAGYEKCLKDFWDAYDQKYVCF